MKQTKMWLPLVVLAGYYFTTAFCSTGVTKLLQLAYKDNLIETPKDCKPLGGGSVVNICNNGTDPLMKISSLTIEPYPLTPGHTVFHMVYKLTKTIPKGTILHLSSFADDKPIYSGPIDLCEYLPFANIYCPVQPTDEWIKMKQVLEIPDDVPPAIYSFVATAVDIDGELVMRMAANIDLRNDDLKRRVHGDDL